MLALNVATNADYSEELRHAVEDVTGETPEFDNAISTSTGLAIVIARIVTDDIDGTLFEIQNSFLHFLNGELTIALDETRIDVLSVRQSGTDCEIWP